MNFPLLGLGWAGLRVRMQSHTIKIIQDDGDHVRVQARAPMEEERGKNLHLPSRAGRRRGLPSHQDSFGDGGELRYRTRDRA